MPDQDGLRLLLESARSGLSRLQHLWLDAGYEGRGKRWAEEALGMGIEIVRKPAKPVPEKVVKRWAEEWAKAEGKKVDSHESLVRGVGSLVAGVQPQVLQARKSAPCRLQ